MPTGHDTVPATLSTVAVANTASSSISDNTPGSEPAKSSSRTSPSENVTRRARAPRCSTAVTRASAVMTASLLQGLNARQSVWLLCNYPVRRELADVKLTPLLDQACRSFRKLATDQKAVGDPNECLVLGVDRMEVRRIVVAEVHVDRDSVELAESRHAGSLW